MLKLIRKMSAGNSLYGTLEVCGKTFLTLENNIYLIPDGIYPITVNFSPKFQRELPLLCDVPHRRGIRIHSGNYSSDSTGCILVGKDVRNCSISGINEFMWLDSRIALKELMILFHHHRYDFGKTKETIEITYATEFGELPF